MVNTSCNPSLLHRVPVKEFARNNVNIPENSGSETNSEENQTILPGENYVSLCAICNNPYSQTFNLICVQVVCCVVAFYLAMWM